uniref:LAM_G_DOMAIN domain-containing protein n=1 Tax=Globodera pallida TaxID=36090 RepID=A0A183C646_GLOPA
MPCFPGFFGLPLDSRRFAAPGDRPPLRSSGYVRESEHELYALQPIEVDVWPTDSSWTFQGFAQHFVKSSSTANLRASNCTSSCIAGVSSLGLRIGNRDGRYAYVFSDAGTACGLKKTQLAVGNLHSQFHKEHASRHPVNPGASWISFSSSTKDLSHLSARGMHVMLSDLIVISTTPSTLSSGSLKINRTGCPAATINSLSFLSPSSIFTGADSVLLQLFCKFSKPNSSPPLQGIHPTTTTRTMLAQCYAKRPQWNHHVLPRKHPQLFTSIVLLLLLTLTSSASVNAQGSDQGNGQQQQSASSPSTSSSSFVLADPNNDASAFSPPAEPSPILPATPQQQQADAAAQLGMPSSGGGAAPSTANDFQQQQTAPQLLDQNQSAATKAGTGGYGTMVPSGGQQQSDADAMNESPPVTGE